MSISGAGSSSSSLMSWLITHNNELNTSLDDAMHQGDLNVATQKELKQILEHMKDPTKYPYGEIAVELKNFVEKHGNDPECGELNGMLTKMRGSYDNADSLNKAGKSTEATAAVSDCSGQLQTQLDSMKQLDELQMMRINDLSSQRGQSFQLASNMMAGTNQVLGGIINNLKG